MKELNILERAKYDGDSKLGFLLDAINPRYVKSDKKAKCSDNIKEIRNDSVGCYTIDFDKEIPAGIDYDISVNNHSIDGVYKCRGWVNFNGTKE